MMPMRVSSPNWQVSSSFRLAATLLGLLAALTSAQEKPANPSARASASLAEAKQTYESVCAACHGLDGRGGERGPDITSRPEAVQKTDAELAEILGNGRPARGMPPFSSFGSARIRAIVSYLRTLQGRGKGVALPGDPERGRVLFFGKANCSGCHSLKGQGGFFASDLATYSGKLGSDELRSKILNPDADLDPRRGLVHVVQSDGTELTGAVRNESNFSVELQTSDGTFHLLNKSELRSQTYVGRSGMPRDYGSTLTSRELDDVVSFLLRTLLESSEQTRKKATAGADNE